MPRFQAESFWESGGKDFPRSIRVFVAFVTSMALKMEKRVFFRFAGLVYGVAISSSPLPQGAVSPDEP